MSTTRTRLSVTAIGLVAAFALVSCSNAAAPITEGSSEVVFNGFGGEALVTEPAEPGGTFVFGTAGGQVETLDPAASLGITAAAISFQVFDQVMAFDPSGEPVPQLAESFTTEDNLTWILKLPSGVTFHDGTELTADAVVKHVTRVAAPESKSGQAGEARRIASTTALDDLTVEFVLAEHNASFPAVFAQGSLAHIPSPTAVEELGDGFGLQPVGLGPYRVESFSPGGAVVLTAFEDYRIAGQPLVETMEFVPALENAARLAGIQTGDLDAGGTRVATVSDEAAAAGLTVLEQPQYKAYTLILNQEVPALSDVRVRQAMNLAIDRGALNNVVFGGKHEEMQGILTPANPYFVETDWPNADPETAAELVAEYEAENGEIVLDLVVPQATEFTNIAAVLQEMYAGVGIEVNYRAATPNAMITEAVERKNQLQLRDTVYLPAAAVSLAFNFASWSAGNHSYASNDELDSLFREYAEQTDPELRRALVEDMQDVLADWLPSVPLVTTYSAFIVGKDVANFPGGFPHTSFEIFDGRTVSMVGGQ